MSYNPEEKKAFLDFVVENGNVSASCRKFHIASATAHRWINERKVASQTSCCAPRAGKLGSAEEEQIRHLIWNDPASCARQYCSELRSCGTKISHTHLQSWLNEAWLGTQLDRALAVEARVSRTGALPPEKAIQALEAMGRSIGHIRLKSSYPSEIIIMSSYRWMRKPNPRSHIIIAVDFYSLMLRVSLTNGEVGGESVRLYQSLVDDLRTACFTADPMRLVRDGTPFAMLKDSQHVIHWVDANKALNKNSSGLRSVHENMMANILRLLISYLSDSGSRPPTMLMMSTLLDWQDEFNETYQLAGIPNFGLTPTQRVYQFANGSGDENQAASLFIAPGEL